MCSSDLGVDGRSPSTTDDLPSVTLAALIQRVVIVAGAAALILTAFGLDSVPEVGGFGATRVCGVVARRWGAWCRTGGGGSAGAAGEVGMRSALAGFVLWVRRLQNLCGDARRSSHGPPDRTRRSHGAGRRTIPDDSRGISAVNRFVLMV